MIVYKSGKLAHHLDSLYGGAMKNTILALAAILGLVTCGGGDKSIPVERVTLNKTSLQIAVGKSEKLIATILPENATNKNLEWRMRLNSDNSGNFSVSNDGTVTGIIKNSSESWTASGTVYVEPQDSRGRYDSATVVVYQPIESITLSDTSLTLAARTSKQLTATILPSDASWPRSAWTSSNAAVATVSASGSVYAVGEGTATITLSAVPRVCSNCPIDNPETETKTAICTVTVAPAGPVLPSMGYSIVSKTLPYTIAVNETVVASGNINNYLLSDISSFTYSSSNASVASVTFASGASQWPGMVVCPSYFIQGISRGTATITVTANLTNGYSVTASMDVRVE
jgi:uncharacterized protein YjdB